MVLEAVETARLPLACFHLAALAKKARTTVNAIQLSGICAVLEHPLLFISCVFEEGVIGKVLLPYGISVGARIPTEKATAALKVCIFIKSLDMILTNDFPKITGFPSLWRSLPPYVRTGPSLGSQSQNAWCRHPGQKLYWTVADIPKAVLCTNLRQAHTKNTHTIIRRH